jgi:hypothetical protein
MVDLLVPLALDLLGAAPEAADGERVELGSGGRVAQNRVQVSSGSKLVSARVVAVVFGPRSFW